MANMDALFWFVLLQAFAVLTYFLGKKIHEYITQIHLPNIIIFGVYIDQKFSLGEKDSICKALRRWEQATKGLIGFTLINSSTIIDLDNLTKIKNHEQIDNIMFIRSSAEDKQILDLDKEYETDILGAADLTYSPKAIFLVADRQDNLKKLSDTVVHEIGHILWLSHSKNKRSIMYRRPTTRKQIITPDDVKNIYPFLGFFIWSLYQKEED